MNNIDFLECSEEEIERFKKTYNLQEIKFEYGYKKVTLNNIPVALIDIDYEYNGYIMIDCFEVFEKGKRIGTTIIKYLLNQNQGRKFCLYSQPKAEIF